MTSLNDSIPTTRARTGKTSFGTAIRIIFPRHRELLPPFEKGLAALVGNLDERGLLDETPVVAMGADGSTPRVSGTAYPISDAATRGDLVTTLL